MKVNNKTLMKYAKAIKAECESRDKCDGCAFCKPAYLDYGCALWEGEIPEFWDLEEVTDE